MLFECLSDDRRRSKETGLGEQGWRDVVECVCVGGGWGGGGVCGGGGQRAGSPGGIGWQGI